MLGDSFLRSAYVVYDLEQNEISIAQTQFNGGADDVREITRGNNVPGATAVARPVTTLAAGTDGARIGGATITVSSVPTNLNVGSVRTVFWWARCRTFGLCNGFHDVMKYGRDHSAGVWSYNLYNLERMMSQYI